MLKLLRNCLGLVVFLAACGPVSEKTTTANNTGKIQAPISQANLKPDTVSRYQFDFLDGQKPLSLLELPRSQDGDFLLTDGFFEADFKSYCLQPGTPDPSDRDAYLMGPLRANRKEIVESILRNSLNKPYLEQKNIQLLLWSVVSGSSFNSLSYPVQATAAQLLTPKQVFELKGGVMGAVKTLAAVMPETGLGGAAKEINQLFELGSSTYEVYERVAVLRQPSEIRHPDYKKDQWYKQPGNYYVRYFPQGYRQVKIQVYVPGGTSSKMEAPGKYLLFDPVTLMAIPANSNAQRLGIGAPMVEIIRQVIQIQKEMGRDKKPPARPKNSKSGSAI